MDIGYEYIDKKFDNYGYTILNLNNLVDNSHNDSNTIYMLNMPIQIYFLDPESGLRKSIIWMKQLMISLMISKININIIM